MVFVVGPLFRVCLIRVTEADHVLIILMHHIISDGWSFEILFRELSTLYNDFLSAREPSLPKLKFQYADFAHWQREHLRNGEITRHIAYWKKRLGGAAPFLQLPTDFPRPAK